MKSALIVLLPKPSKAPKQIRKSETHTFFKFRSKIICKLLTKHLKKEILLKTIDSRHQLIHSQWFSSLMLRLWHYVQSLSALELPSNGSVNGANICGFIWNNRRARLCLILLYLLFVNLPRTQPVSNHRVVLLGGEAEICFFIFKKRFSSWGCNGILWFTLTSLILSQIGHTKKQQNKLKTQLLNTWGWKILKKNPIHYHKIAQYGVTTALHQKE